MKQRGIYILKPLQIDYDTNHDIRPNPSIRLIGTTKATTQHSQCIQETSQYRTAAYTHFWSAIKKTVLAWARNCKAHRVGFTSFWQMNGTLGNYSWSLIVLGASSKIPVLKSNSVRQYGRFKNDGIGRKKYSLGHEKNALCIWSWYQWRDC